MNVLVSVIILILAMLIQAFMQLSSGIFSLFYHYALGKKSRKKADSLSPYYILGYGLFIVAVIFIMCIFIFTLDKYSLINFTYFSWALSGILIAEAVASLFFYYRKGKTTETFISRRIARNIEDRIKNAKTKSDAFVLGFISSFPELVFTLPLYLTIIITLINFTILPRAMVLILFLVIALSPLFFVLAMYHTDRHLANIIRLRLKLKPFIKAFLCLGYLMLATLIILGVFYYG